MILLGQSKFNFCIKDSSYYFLILPTLIIVDDYALTEKSNEEIIQVFFEYSNKDTLFYKVTSSKSTLVLLSEKPIAYCIYGNKNIIYLYNNANNYIEDENWLEDIYFKSKQILINDNIEIISWNKSKYRIIYSDCYTFDPNEFLYKIYKNKIISKYSTL